jgi:hypothetical protein
VLAAGIVVARVGLGMVRTGRAALRMTLALDGAAGGRIDHSNLR